MADAVRMCLARSLAGHDKDRIYLVVREDETYCCLCDGKSKTVLKPKKKRKKHVQRIIHLNDVINRRVEEISRMLDRLSAEDPQIARDIETQINDKIRNMLTLYEAER